MMTSQDAKSRTERLNLSAGCGVARPIEDRLRDVAIDLLRVQAETLDACEDWIADDESCWQEYTKAKREAFAALAAMKKGQPL